MSDSHLGGQDEGDVIGRRCQVGETLHCGGGRVDDFDAIVPPVSVVQRCLDDATSVGILVDDDEHLGHHGRDHIRRSLERPGGPGSLQPDHEAGAT